MKTKRMILALLLMAAMVSAQDTGFISGLLNNFANNTISSLWDPLIKGVNRFIIYNPDLNEWPTVKELQTLFWVPVTGFFIVLMTWVGVKWIFYSETETGRAQAKADFKRAFVGMIFVAICPFLFDLGLSISTDLSNALISSRTGTDYTAFFLTIMAQVSVFPLCLGPFMILGLILVGITLAARILALFLVAVTLPLAIAFYFSDVQWLKSLGTRAVNLYFSAIIAQILMSFFFALMLTTGNTALQLFGQDAMGASIAYFMAMSCLALTVLAPFMTLGLMKPFASVIGIGGSALAVAAPLIPEAGLVAGLAKGVAHGMNEMEKMSISDGFHAGWKGSEQLEKAGSGYLKEKFKDKGGSYGTAKADHVGGSWGGGYVKNTIPNSGGRNVQSGLQEGAVKAADSEYHNASTDPGKVDFMMSAWNTDIGSKAQDEYNRNDPHLQGRKHSRGEGDYQAEALRQYQLLKDNDVIREDDQGNIHVGHMGQELANKYNVPLTSYRGSVPHGPESFHDDSRGYTYARGVVQDGQTILKNSISQNFTHEGSQYTVAAAADPIEKGSYNVIVEGNNQSAFFPIDTAAQEVSSRQELIQKIQSVSNESGLQPEWVASTMAEGYKPIGISEYYGLNDYTWMKDNGNSYDYQVIDPNTKQARFWNSIKGGGN